MTAAQQSTVMAEPRAPIVPVLPHSASVLRVYGLRRSGNHAVIDWLLRNAPGTGTVFLNDCAPQSYGYGSSFDADNPDITQRRHALRDDPDYRTVVTLAAGDKGFLGHLHAGLPGRCSPHTGPRCMTAPHLDTADISQTPGPAAPPQS